MENLNFSLDALENAIDEIILIGMEFKRNDFQRFGISLDTVNNNGWELYYKEYMRENIHKAIGNVVKCKYLNSNNGVITITPFEIIISIFESAYVLFSGAVNRFEKYLEYALYSLKNSQPEIFDIQVANNKVIVK